MAEIIDLFEDNKSIWLGMDDYLIKLKKSNHLIELNYLGEPPHGDSYHQMKIDGVIIQGYFWGCMFLFPVEQNYIVCSWMSKIYERKTIIIDIKQKRYHIFEDYWYDFNYENGLLVLGNEKFNIAKEVVINNITSWNSVIIQTILK